jgi:hypothetical protein
MTRYATVDPGIAVPLGEERPTSRRLRQTAKPDPVQVFDYYVLPGNALVSLDRELSRGLGSIEFTAGGKVVKARKVSLFRSDDFKEVVGERLYWGRWTSAGTMQRGMLRDAPVVGLVPYLPISALWAVALLTAEQVADAIRLETIAALDKAVDAAVDLPRRDGLALQVTRWRAIRSRLASEVAP